MKRVLICPICGSIEIELDSAGYTGKYYCKKCRYVGSFIIEMDEGEYQKLKESGEIEKFLEIKSTEKPKKEKKHEKYPF